MRLTSFLHHLLFASMLACLSATVVRAMIGARLLDRPDLHAANGRKAHRVPTPKGGGLGIVAAFMAGIALLYAFAQFSRLANGYFIGLILASAAIALVAFIDDVRNWPFTVKLAAQFAAAAAAVCSGLYIGLYRVPYFGAVDIGLLGVPLTLFWIVFATNAMNFIDGLDGLAGGVSLIACTFLSIIGAAQHGWFLYFAAMLLAAGLVGFLPFNFPRARIFMGDVGSQFCGFVLAVLGISASRFDGVQLSFTLVPLLLSGVLYDVAFTLGRRALARERLTHAHRSHLYQLAHRAGMKSTHVTLMHWAFALGGGACCLAFLHAASSYKPLILLLPLVPQLGWTVWVLRAAHRHNLLLTKKWCTAKDNT